MDKISKFFLTASLILLASKNLSGMNLDRLHNEYGNNKQAETQEFLRRLHLLHRIEGHRSYDRIEYYKEFPISLLHYACFSGNIDLVRYLITNGANINIQPYRLLHSDSVDIDMPLLLCLHNAWQIGWQNSSDTIYDIATYLCECGAQITFKRLAENGSTSTITTNVLFHLAYFIDSLAATHDRGRQISLKLVHLYAKHGADINIKDQNGQTPEEVIKDENLKQDFIKAAKAGKREYELNLLETAQKIAFIQTEEEKEEEEMKLCSPKEIHLEDGQKLFLPRFFL